MHSGAVAVSLNPHFTAIELSTILQDCGAKTVVSSTDFCQVVQSIIRNDAGQTDAGLGGGEEGRAGGGAEDGERLTNQLTGVVWFAGQQVGSPHSSDHELSQAVKSSRGLAACYMACGALLDAAGASPPPPVGTAPPSAGANPPPAGVDPSPGGCTPAELQRLVHTQLMGCVPTHNTEYLGSRSMEHVYEEAGEGDEGGGERDSSGWSGASPQ